MTRPLDVLVIESQRSVGDDATTALRSAGHRVVRCHDPQDRGFPCRALKAGAGCPLDGRVDVAVLVRRNLHPHPTPLEGGVSCAFRAGVPIVEDGPDVLDPFDPWIAERVDTRGVVAACEDVVAREFEPLRELVESRISPLLQAAGLGPESVHCSVEAVGSALRVHLHTDASIDRALEQALGVRVLDAVRAFDRTYGQVDVDLHRINPPIHVAARTPAE